MLKLRPKCMCNTITRTYLIGITYLGERSFADFFSVRLLTTTHSACQKEEFSVAPLSRKLSVCVRTGIRKSIVLCVARELYLKTVQTLRSCLPLGATL